MKCPECGLSLNSTAAMRRHYFKHLWEGEEDFPPDWDNPAPEQPPEDDDDTPPEDPDDILRTVFDYAMHYALMEDPVPESENTLTGEEALKWAGEPPEGIAEIAPLADRGLGIGTAYAPPGMWGPWAKSPSAHLGPCKSRVRYKQMAAGPLVVGQVKWINSRGKWITKGFRNSIVVQTGNYTGHIYVRLTSYGTGVGCRVTF